MKFDYETYNRLFHPIPETITTTGAIEPIRKTKPEPAEKEPLKNDDKSGVAEGPEVAEKGPEEGAAGTPNDGGVDDGATTGTCETDG